MCLEGLRCVLCQINEEYPTRERAVYGRINPHETRHLEKIRDCEVVVYMRRNCVVLELLLLRNDGGVYNSSMDY